MKQLDWFKQTSIKVQLILFSAMMSLLIGGMAFFVLHWSEKALQNDAAYMKYISQVNQVYQLQEENIALLQQLIESLNPSAKITLEKNQEDAYFLLNQLEKSAVSIDASMRIRVTRYLLKRLEKHVEEMIWLREFEQDSFENIDVTSPYYVLYTESLDLVSRTKMYLQEILQLSVEENQHFIEQAANNTQSLQKVVLFFVGLVVLLSTGFYIFFANYVTRLVQMIAFTTKKIAISKNNEKIAFNKGPKEIRELTTHFNQLLETLYLLNDKAKEKASLELRLTDEKLKQIKIKEALKESQLQGLQMQIKPHFLFNTLNVIAMTALLEEAKEAYTLMIALSKFMRHSLKKAKTYGTVEEEVDMISQYLYILKARMGKQLTYHVEAMPTTYPLKIPLFTLQPLVENAYKHGIEESIEEGKILVQIKKNHSFLYLKVYNNGKGMPKDILTSIREKVYSKEIDLEKYEHIGIANVAYRLNMLFEDKVRYQILSSKSRGTLFVIQIDLKEANLNV